MHSKLKHFYQKTDRYILEKADNPILTRKSSQNKMASKPTSGVRRVMLAFCEVTQGVGDT